VIGISIINAPRQRKKDRSPSLRGALDIQDHTAIAEVPSDMDAEITALEGETVQGAAGQSRHDVRVADGEGEIGVSIRREVV
jgi:hypothetical protein